MYVFSRQNAVTIICFLLIANIVFLLKLTHREYRPEGKLYFNECRLNLTETLLHPLEREGTSPKILYQSSGPAGPVRISYYQSLVQRIPVNTASMELLAVLPGISHLLAEKIVRERERNGLFLSFNEFLIRMNLNQDKWSGLQDHLLFRICNE